MVTTRSRFIVAAALPLALTACSPAQRGDDPLPQTQKCATTPEVPTEGLALLVGYGNSSAFKPLVAGAELPLQHGPQGGTHVYIDVLFHAETAGPWKIVPHLARPSGSQESDAAVVTACAGWNRVQNVRLVLSAGGGEGELDVTAAPIDGKTDALKSAPIAVSIR